MNTERNKEICKLLVVDFDTLISITDITHRQNSIKIWNTSTVDLVGIED